ncbi:hypothetical protein [Embleya sp. NPDC005575]|uniref:hypothetical protein n=1 Tax=Embleya sp. NPDC005575 TaxID=3156892 RepID=UPI0033AFFDF9
MGDDAQRRDAVNSPGSSSSSHSRSTSRFSFDRLPSIFPAWAAGPSLGTICLARTGPARPG